MDKMGSILVVDDNQAILSALKILLPRHFSMVKLLSSPTNLVSEVKSVEYNVILLDMNFKTGINSGNEGIYWLSELKKHSPASEVVLFTAYADIDLAVNAIKQGAFDFVSKPWDNAKLISTLSAAYKMSLSRRENKKLKEIKREIRSQGEMYWGESASMRELKSLIEKVAPTDATILITGENGTGKDMLAGEIHRLSLRSKESMVSVDIGSLPESLFESELFGHVKGAFTDAKGDRAGKFEVADGGTLFLDEIGNVPLHLQSKLLRAIQSRSVVRVGSNTPIPTDVRLIAATNKNLSEMVAKGEFREDLFYRINTFHVELPPLRDRREDILPLTERFMNSLSKKYSKGINSISDEAKKELLSFRWNGNIRELQHAVEKAVILSEGDVLQKRDFLLRSDKGGYSLESDSVKTLEDMEKEMIRHAINLYNGNLSQVASHLGITRQTLYNKLKRYEI